jgi:hypothetical protein
VRPCVECASLSRSSSLPPRAAKFVLNSSFHFFFHYFLYFYIFAGKCWVAVVVSLIYFLAEWIKLVFWRAATTSSSSCCCYTRLFAFIQNLYTSDGCVSSKCNSLAMYSLHEYVFLDKIYVFALCMRNKWAGRIQWASFSFFHSFISLPLLPHRIMQFFIFFAHKLTHT